MTVPLGTSVSTLKRFDTSPSTLFCLSGMMITTLTYFLGHCTSSFNTVVYHVVRCQKLWKNLIWRRPFEFS